MPKKYDLITELYKRTAQTVVSSPMNWQEFLRSACNNFRLRFDEQLLVFAQRPDATAVLPINGGLGCKLEQNFWQMGEQGGKGDCGF